MYIQQAIYMVRNNNTIAGEWQQFCETGQQVSTDATFT